MCVLLFLFFFVFFFSLIMLSAHLETRSKKSCPFVCSHFWTIHTYQNVYFFSLSSDVYVHFHYYWRSYSKSAHCESVGVTDIISILSCDFCQNKNIRNNCLSCTVSKCNMAFDVQNIRSSALAHLWHASQPRFDLIINVKYLTTITTKSFYRQANKGLFFLLIGKFCISYEKEKI